jgi:hypothetical protein
MTWPSLAAAVGLLRPSTAPPIVAGMPTPKLMTPPIPIDLALCGGTIVESARLRERYVLPFVVDAMVLIEDALRRTADYVPTIRPGQPGVVPWPKPSALSHLMALHAIRVYGKPDMLEEVAEHLPEIAARKGRDLGPALALIRAEYMPQMRLVDPSGISLPDAEELLAQVAAIDLDDEPTARLSRLLDPSILLTRDRKSLLRFGLGQWVEDPDMDAVVSITKDEWLKATLRVRNRAFSAHVEVGGRVVTVTGNAVTAGARKAVSVAIENPIPAALLLAGLVMLLWATRDSPVWPQVRDGIKKNTAVALTEFAGQTEGRPQAAAAAGAKVEAYLAKHAAPDLDVAMIARALAIAPIEGLTAAELREITGYRVAVRPILTAHPAFVADEAGRWHLGVAARLLA